MSHADLFDLPPPDPGPGADRAAALAREAACGAQPDDVRSLTLLLGLALSVRRYRLPLSGRAVPLRLLLPPCEHVLETLQAIESPIEYELYALLAAHGLADEFEPQGIVSVRFVEADGTHAIRPAKPDFVHRRLRVAIYCDSTLHHTDITALGRDHEVTEALLAAGWYALRVTSRQVASAPLQTVERVRLALEVRAGSGGRGARRVAP